MAVTKEIQNDNSYRQLLFNRCILHYAYIDNDQIHEWYDVDPLIVGISQFQQAMKKLSNPGQRWMFYSFAD